MACIRSRRGFCVLDYRLLGRRITKSFLTRRLAEPALATLRVETGRRQRSVVEPLIIVRDYVPCYLANCAEAEVAARIGGLRVASITRADVRGMLLKEVAAAEASR